MNLENVQKLLVEAKKLSNHGEFVILGSLAVLGVQKQAPERMLMSIDVDLYIKNDPGRTHLLTKELGEGSNFDSENGFYLDSVSPKLPSFPAGWEDRLVLIKLSNEISAYFVEIHDVAVSKCMRGENRDREWIRAGALAEILDIGKIKVLMGTANALEGELALARIRLDEDEAMCRKTTSKNIRR